jgi:hypothetical protein
VSLNFELRVLRRQQRQRRPMGRLHRSTNGEVLRGLVVGVKYHGRLFHAFARRFGNLVGDQGHTESKGVF